MGRGSNLGARWKVSKNTTGILDAWDDGLTTSVGRKCFVQGVVGFVHGMDAERIDMTRV